MNKKTSVIVPVYNVSAYLSECIDSILGQTHTDIELILVDDGSTDSSGKICDDYAANDNRIKVIHKPNGGLRSAIIAGCNAVSGDYVLFVDGDDYIKPSTVETLTLAAEKYDADCVQFEYAYIQDGVEEHFSHNKFEMLDGNALRQEALFNWFETAQNHTQWNRGRTTKFYTSSLIKKIIPYVDTQISLCEDQEFSLWALLYCKNYVSIEGEYLYCWRYVDNSMSKNVTQEYIDKHLYFFDVVKKFAVTNNIPHTALDKIVDSIWIQLLAGTFARKIPFANKHKFLKIIKSHCRSKDNILFYANDYAFITKNALKYIIRFDCFVPCLLSQIYLMVKK